MLEKNVKIVVMPCGFFWGGKATRYYDDFWTIKSTSFLLLGKLKKIQKNAKFSEKNGS